MMIAPERKRTIYISKIAAAFLIVASSMRLPKHSMLSFLLKTETAENSKTAIVVVFIPPAVEPGEPPISINIIVNV